MLLFFLGEQFLHRIVRLFCLAPKATLLLAVHRPLDPDGQQHTLQLATNEPVKVVDAGSVWR